MALKNNNRVIKNLYIADSASHLCNNNRNVKAQIKDKKFFSQLLGDVNHQNIAIEVSPLTPPHYETFLNQSQCTILILDQITDPHNVGAIIRNASAFGVDCIIMPQDNSPPESGIIAKTSAGALETVPIIYVTNIVHFIKEAKSHGFWCYGADGNAKISIDEEKFASKKIIIMGSEGKGMRKLVREHCDILIKIPTSGTIESLNVSCAAAVILHTIYNQK